MSDQEFDQGYVKKLREEAANWRTKYRELEAQQQNQLVQVELAKRGIQADPSWVKLDEGQDVGEAIDALVAQYPSLEGSGGGHHSKYGNEGPTLDDFYDEPEVKPKLTPKPISPSSQRSTSPKPVRAARITKRNIEEIRKDPKARAKIRDQYREMLKQGSNQTGE